MKFDMEVLVAVDFDGTLTYPHKFGEPYVINPKAVAWCKQARELGATLILWTCRHGDGLREPIRELKGLGLPFGFVNCDPGQRNSSAKVNADIYVDDKSYPRGIPWRRLMRRLKKLIRLRAKGIAAE